MYNGVIVQKIVAMLEDRLAVDLVRSFGNRFEEDKNFLGEGTGMATNGFPNPMHNVQHLRLFSLGVFEMIDCRTENEMSLWGQTKDDLSFFL